MRLVKYRHGKYWGIVEDIIIEVDGDKYRRQRFVINLPGSISEEDAQILLKDLEQGKAEVHVDRFGHKYVVEADGAKYIGS